MTTTAITASGPGMVGHGVQALGNMPPGRQEPLEGFANLDTPVAGADLRRRCESDREARARGAAPESLAAARKADSDPPVRPA